MFLFSYIAASSVKSKQNIKTKPPFIPKSLYRNKKRYSQPAVSFKILTKIKQKQYSQTPADAKKKSGKKNKVKMLLALNPGSRKKPLQSNSCWFERIPGKKREYSQNAAFSETF